MLSNSIALWKWDNPFGGRALKYRAVNIEEQRNVIDSFLRGLLAGILRVFASQSQLLEIVTKILYKYSASPIKINSKQLSQPQSLKNEISSPLVCPRRRNSRIWKHEAEACSDERQEPRVERQLGRKSECWRRRQLQSQLWWAPFGAAAWVSLPVHQPTRTRSRTKPRLQSRGPCPTAKLAVISTRHPVLSDLPIQLLRMRAGGSRFIPERGQEQNLRDSGIHLRAWDSQQNWSWLGHWEQPRNLREANHLPD